MAKLALHIYRNLGLNCSGVGLSTVHPNCRTKPWNASELVLRKLYSTVDKNKVDVLWYGNNSDTASRDACLRAWISARVAENALPEVRSAKKVDTNILQHRFLDCLGRLVVTIDLLNAAKPTTIENEFDSVEMGDGQQLILQNSRFKTRVRRSNQTSVIMNSSHGGDIVGRAIYAHGRSTNIQVLQGRFRRDVGSVRVVGRDDATFPEVAREQFLLQLLQGKGPPILPVRTDTVEVHPAFSMLNMCQCSVAAAMISPSESLVITHGPPGTGKTTTIAAAVKYWSLQRSPVWIVARSNVAVRNIARSLVSNNVSDFKLIVSKEFYLEWHEDLYARVANHLIRSDDLFSDSVTFERRFNGSRVVLCTLSMLSNPALDEIGVFDLIPVDRLVVDEASQVDTFDFMHLFHKFKRLRKVCFFGDPEQLPPFGQEIAPEMRSIFDIKHLQTTNCLLSQYSVSITSCIG
ncbi:unnamed protein product [Somion occarium]|uniref:DNA2/NAM7 helicase helicase domain-containing protein n=1 Tax=Somion occarium TaxID=3059160 RepID=A0ABP1DVR7_9APHY